MYDTAVLRAQIADAITFHPGNRTGTPEHRHPVSLILADSVLQHVVPELERLSEERDGAYRERAQLLAEFATRYPAVLAPAPDIDEPGWTLLYVTLPTGQASWHQHPADYELFGHVERVQADDPRAQWDGHTTEEKYRRIADLVAQTPEELSDRCPRCQCDDCGGRLDQHTEAGCSCESCQISPNLACSLAEFLPSVGIDYIAQQLGPLLSVHLGARQQARCRAVAHAANHALRDYDQQQEGRRG